MPNMELTIIILLVLSILFWLSGFYFLFRIPKCKLSDKVTDYPTFAIIIPARNEENNIGKLLDSINIQNFKPNEIIVVNDSSTDRTKEIALENEATVIDSKNLPEGWLGKPWACFQGAKSAKSDIFIFLDSDIEVEENEGLKKIVDTFLDNQLRENIVMSISPFHKVKDWYEELSAIFNIIMTGSMNAFTPFKKAEPNGLFGPAMIVSRENYFKINGHESVKNRILENMFMAELFKKAGVGLMCYGGSGSLSFRMYSSGLRDLVNGWSKAFASGAGQISIFSLLNIILWISGGFIITALLIYSFLTSFSSFIWIILYLGFSIQLLWMLKRIGTFRIISAFLFPVHLLSFCLIFVRSLIYKKLNKSIQWKSREVKS